MIRLPDIPQLQGSPVNMPEARVGAVAATATALTGLGRTLAEVSDQFFGTAVQMQKLKNARTVSEKRMQLQSEWAALELELEREPDPEAMIRRSQEFFQSRQGIIDDPELPPAVRAEMTEYYQNFAHQNTIRISEKAANKEIKRGVLAMENEIDSAVRVNDLAGGVAAIDRMLGAGAILPEQAESMKRKVEERITLQGHEAAIMQDANGWMQAHPRDKVPAGMDPGVWRQLQGQADSEMRRQTSDDIEGVLDIIHSGKPVSEEQLKQATAHLKPSVQVRLHGAWQDQQTAGYKAMTASPEYQAEVVGRVSMLLSNYNPEAEGFDEQYVEMDALVRTLPTSHPVRAELARQITAARDGAEMQIKDARGAALKAIDTAAKAGRFGPTSGDAPAIQPTQKAINDGFIRDKDKLASLGFSPEQVAEIYEAVPKGKDGDTRPPTDLERRRRFERLWEYRTGEDKASSSVRATALAIVNQESDIRDLSPEAAGERAAAVLATERKVGEIKTNLMEWLDANPKASGREIEDKANEIGGTSVREEMRRSYLPARPSRPASIAPETSMNLPAPLQPLDSAFREMGVKYGIDPRFLAAVAMHETGGGTSSAFRNKNNAMGVSNSKGPIAFEDSRHSIERMARLLASTSSGPYKNARTIAEIAGIYAPIGAGNDPGSLNKHWTAGVTKFYRQLGGDPSAPLKS